MNVDFFPSGRDHGKNQPNHDQRADPMFSQFADRKLDVIRGMYPLDVMALGP